MDLLSCSRLSSLSDPLNGIGLPHHDPQMPTADRAHDYPIQKKTSLLDCRVVVHPSRKHPSSLTAIPLNRASTSRGWRRTTRIPALLLLLIEAYQMTSPPRTPSLFVTRPSEFPMFQREIVKVQRLRCSYPNVSSFACHPPSPCLRVPSFQIPDPAPRVEQRARPPAFKQKLAQIHQPPLTVTPFFLWSHRIRELAGELDTLFLIILLTCRDQLLRCSFSLCVARQCALQD